MAKGLVFTMTNKAAGVKILWDEFPNIKPTNLDDATALNNGVHVMDRFLQMALQGQPENTALGEFIPANWENTRSDFSTLGTIKGTDPATAAYTTKFIAACNDFDHAAVAAQAKQWAQ